jgi:hypothetical protein
MRANAPAHPEQLRLPLAPACTWHEHAGAAASAVPRRAARPAVPCPRDARISVTDPVRGRRAVCCLPHALALVMDWRASIPNRRRDASRVALGWLPDAPRRHA